jgi:short-subunit dehydrogenase
MSYNPYTLEGKTILITGASSGIGRETAIECSKLGAKLIITGRNEERLLETFKNLQNSDHQMIISDLGAENGVKNLVSQLTTLDGIVHSAGITSNVPFQFATREKFDRIMDVNFFAPVEISRLAIKEKKLN